MTQKKIHWRPWNRSVRFRGPILLSLAAGVYGPSQKVFHSKFVVGLSLATGLYGPSQKVFHSKFVVGLSLATGLYGPSQKVFHPLGSHGAVSIPIPGLALAQTRIPALCRNPQTAGRLRPGFVIPVFDRAPPWDGNRCLPLHEKPSATAI